MLTDEKCCSEYKRLGEGRGANYSGHSFYCTSCRNLHKRGIDLGQRTSIRRAITSKSKGLEPKSEFRSLTWKLG